MPTKFHFGKDTRTNGPAMLVQHQSLPEPVDVMAHLRTLHEIFPNEWAQVSLEIAAPEGKRLILNGDLPTTN
jgi:hypothetical protein